MTGSGPDGGDRAMVLTPETGSTLAWANRHQPVKNTFTFNGKSLVGKFCGFGIYNVGTDPDNAGLFPVGTTDHFISQFNAADSQTEEVGLFWHVRNANGKLIVVWDVTSLRTHIIVGIQ